MNGPMLLGTLGVIVLVFLAVLYAIVRNLLYICQPNEVLIFIGGRTVTAKRHVGYRIIKGWRAVRRSCAPRTAPPSPTSLKKPTSSR